MAPPRCLWLESTQHIGHVGGTATSPEATFVGTASENRVDGLSNGLAPMLKYRVTSVYTETGGHLDASYSDTECVRGSPPQPHANDKRCYPARGPPEGGAELTDWFPKYAVTQVAAIDLPRVPGCIPRPAPGAWSPLSKRGPRPPLFTTPPSTAPTSTACWRARIQFSFRMQNLDKMQSDVECRSEAPRRRDHGKWER